MAGERAPEPVMVQEKSNGHLRLVDAGTGAVLHGMMSMLSEVLDGLDRRLDSLESRLDTLGKPDDATASLAQSVRDHLDGIESRLGALVRDRLEAEGEQRAALESILCERLEALGERFDDAARADDERMDRVAALEAAVAAQGDLFDGVRAAVAESAERVEESVQAAVSRRTAEIEASLAEGRAEAEAAVARLTAKLESSLDDDRTALASWMEEALAGLSSTLSDRMGEAERWTGDRTDGIEARIGERLDGMAERLTADTAGQVQAVRDAVGSHLDALEGRVDERFTALGDRVDRSAGLVAERVSQTEQLSLGRLEQTERHVAEKVDAAAAQISDEISSRVGDAAAAIADAVARVDGMEGKLVVGQAEVTSGIEAVTLQLGEVDATLAALRAEGAALPASIGEVVGTALSSWRNRLRKGDGEDALRKTFDELAARLARIEDVVGDGLTRVHEAVNRAQGESLEAAQTTSAEVRRLLDAARAEAERAAAGTVEAVVGQQRKLAADVVQELRKPTPADEEQLDAMAAVAERLVALHDEVGRRHSALSKAIEQSTQSAMQRVAEAEVAIAASLAQQGAGDDGRDRRDQAAIVELVKLREAVLEAQGRAGAVATAVAKQVERAMQEAVAAVGAVGERVDKVPAAVAGLIEIEPHTDEAVLEAVRALGGRIDRVPDALRSTFEEVQEVVAEVAGYERDRADQARAVLDAVGRANQEHQDILQALHSSLAKRFDVRTKTITEALDGLASTLEAARKLGPSLDKVSSRLDAQQPFLDQIRHQLVQLAATVATVPADVERRHAEASVTLEKVTESLAGLRKHAAALDRSVQGMRASHEGLAAAVVDLRDGQGVVPQRLDQIGSAVQSSRQQLGEVGELTRSVAVAVDQQQAMGNRLAELVNQVRAATRSDIERVESSIHLEVLKQHQQDQARLTQAVAGVSDVVEREAAVIAQRVSALAGEVDAIRADLLTLPAAAGTPAEL